MGMMTGTGPLGRQPAGQFNFDPPAPGSELYLEPTPKRVRAVVDGKAIADSRHAMLLSESGVQPIYYFPPEDVRTDLFEPSDKHTHCPKKGDASYYTLRIGERVVKDVAWYYPEPIEGAPSIKDLIAFYWDRVDQWFEEDEEVIGHARDPYHRIDIRQSSRHVRISVDGQLLAESRRPVALFESNLPVRWYLPREDVVADLEPSDRTSLCPYKGVARYYSVPGGPDMVWYYADPLPEALPIAGLLCFFNERVDLELDGELQERPARPPR
jgi:uncharacterized protein (DUF427 family)